MRRQPSEEPRSSAPYEDRHLGTWPSIGAGSVIRQALLDAVESPDVITVFAPLGFGKTTLAVQHAQRLDRSTIWVTLDQHDNDTVVFVSKLVDALETVSPADRSLRQALSAPGPSPWARLVPRLVTALAAVEPGLLVFDDVHEVESQEVHDIITWVALQSRPPTQVMLIGRAANGVHLARLRLACDVLEIGAEDLALSNDEAVELLSAVGLEAMPADVERTNARCEGWPAGVRLAALSCCDRDRPDSEPPSLQGSDHVVADYVRSELLASLTEEQASFMVRTSVLHRMSAALCDFVLERSGSGLVLRELERANAFIAAVDRDQRWYRSHDLVRESLLAELERQDPALPGRLRARAAEWHAANLMAVEAIHYRQNAGDDAATVRMMAAYAQQLYGYGRTATILEWLGWAEERDLLGVDPVLAMSGAITLSIQGDAERAARFATALDAIPVSDARAPDQDELRAWQAVVRAYGCAGGAVEAVADGERACALVARDDPWRPVACMALGLALVMDGDRDDAERVLVEIAPEAQIEGRSPNARSTALGLRARSCLEQGDLDRARTLLATASEVRRTGALEGQGPQVLLEALLARAAVAEGHSEEAWSHLGRAQKLRPLLTWAMPSLAVIARIELARTHLALADAPGARTLVLEIQDVLHRRPRLGRLVEESERIREQLAEIRGGVVGASTLTGAELRLVPMLATHLTFAEIGSRLMVSENTIKSQAMSVYRKLDATSRGEAVDHAVRAGLIDPAAVTRIVLSPRNAGE